MRELSLDLPPPPPASTGSGGFTPPQSAIEPPPSTSRDPFGIVGTVQADTFAVESVVAHGGFGVIYKARHVRFRAPVALKCLKIPANLSRQERTEFFERFRGEGEVMFRLSSSIPEVVRPMAVDALKLPDGRFVPFIALEWLEGETLKDVIVRRLQDDLPPVSLAKAVEMLTPVARGLARAHRFPGPEGVLAILHCDLKPDNLFVAKTADGEVFKIFDFGIAKVRSAATRVAGGETKTDAASNMFTPAYAAPEQWAPDQFGQTGPWTDVFALALTLTELVTQKPAIDGAPAAMLAQSLDLKKRPTPGRLGLAISPAIDRIFTHALAVDPKDRTQSVEEFWGALEDACRLPSQLGGGGRLSMVSVAPLPTWEADPLLRASSSNPPSNMTHSEPPQSQKQSVGGDFPSLDLDLPPRGLPSPAPQPSAAAAASTAQPFAPAAVGSFEEAPAGFDEAGAFDLAADIERGPAPSGAVGTAPVGASLPGMPAVLPGEGSPQQEAELGELAGPSGRERLAAAANVAGAVASQAAGAAARGAKSLAQKAIHVDRSQVIRLDDPLTWIRPMRGPIVALAAALLITIAAVVYNKIAMTNFKVVFVSLPLFLAAIGFAVYRFNKLDKE